MSAQDDLYVARRDLLVEAAQCKPQQTQHRASCATTCLQSPQHCYSVPHFKSNRAGMKSMFGKHCKWQLTSTLPCLVLGCEDNRGDEGAEYRVSNYLSPKRSILGVAMRVASDRCRRWCGATGIRCFLSAHSCSQSRHITSRSACTWTCITRVFRQASTSAVASLHVNCSTA